MFVQRDKIYITAGGYVVKLSYNLCAPVNMSPGQNTYHRCADVSGWQWQNDGRILGLTPEWGEKLKIVEECPFELPTVPDGYRWVDGFPQVRIPKRGEYFLSYDSRTKKFGEVKCCDRDYVTPYDTDGRRFILGPVKVKSKYYRHKDKFYGDTLYVKRTGKTFNTIGLNGIEKSCRYKEDWDTIEDSLVNDGRWIEVPEEVALDTISKLTKSSAEVVKYYNHRDKFAGEVAFIKRTGDKYKCIKKNGESNLNQAWFNTCDLYVRDGIWIEISEGDTLKLLDVNSVTSVPDVSSSKNEKVIAMKKETALKVVGAVARFAGNWGFRALNYWVFEPAAGFGKPIVKSVRYATFLTMVAGSIYGYYHPQEVKDAIKSCLPKITIEAPEIMQG